VKRAVVGPALLCVLVPALAAQQPVPELPAPTAVFRSTTNLVPLTVTVTDANKQFVKGLAASDFTVLEDGVPQEIQFFEAKEIPLDLILLLDTSSSMTDKMKVVHEAAVGFLQTLRPIDRGAVVGFADGVSVLHRLTPDRAALEAAIRRTVARGATSLHNALYISLREFGRSARQQGSVRRQAIAVLSDGEDTSSLVTFEDVLALARTSGVSIYPIALKSGNAARVASGGGRRFFSEAEYSMRMLAQETGAQAFFPMEIAELKTIYAAIGQELAHQYSIAYAPTNPRADGRFRKIAVRIAAHPELRPRTRTGYTASLARTSAASPSPSHAPHPQR
jgi:Ca-activated chloride channel family protein